MIIYNIRKSRYADTLKASGVANRWNKNEEFVIYAGSSISLATIELIAHRSSIDIKSDYKVLFIKVDMIESDITEIKKEELPRNWTSIEAYPVLQEMGSHWYQSKGTLLLRVPSVLIPWEFNYLINLKHPDFSKKVSILSVEDFNWGDRLI